MSKKSKHVLLGLIIALIAIVVIIVLCYGFSSQQSSESTDSTPNIPTDITPSSDDSASDDVQSTADFTSIVNDFCSQIDQKANDLSSEYEKAKFVNGESDARLSQRASDGYDALEKLYDTAKAKLLSEKIGHSGSDSAYNAALTNLDTNYNNSVQRLKDDIANLNS